MRRLECLMIDICAATGAGQGLSTTPETVRGFNAELLRRRDEVESAILIERRHAAAEGGDDLRARGIECALERAEIAEREQQIRITFSVVDCEHWIDCGWYLLRHGAETRLWGFYRTKNDAEKAKEEAERAEAGAQ